MGNKTGTKPPPETGKPPGNGHTEPKPGSDPEAIQLNVFTIQAHDPVNSQIYYYSTDPTTPPNFVPAGSASFKVFTEQATDTIPVYLFTTEIDDFYKTLVYYYSTSRTPPPNFRGPGTAYHAYPSERPGTVPVYQFFGTSGDPKQTRLYYYSSKEDAPDRYSKQPEALFWAPNPGTKQKPPGTPP